MSRVPVSERIHGRAALAREDREDARRGAPDVDLSAYAAARGLDFLGSANAAGYFAALPLEAPLQHNVLRGTLDGREVCFWHWRYPWPVSGDEHLGPGTFHDVRITPPLKRLFSVRRMISRTEADNFFVGVPCTGAATLVPEAALLHDFRIDNWEKHFLGGGNETKLAQLPGFTLTGDVPAPVLDALLAGPAAGVLQDGARQALFELRCRFGTLTLRRNGYAKTEAEVDALLDAVATAGDALRDACASLHAPRPFGEPLPPADWPEHEPAIGRPWPPSPLLEKVHEEARARGLTLEDPQAYHRAFPTMPVPGTAWAVMRGTVPGLPAPARIAIHAELPIAEVNSGRTALLLPANGLAPTAASGVKVEHDGDPMRYAVRDGILAVTVLRWRPLDLGDIDALLSRGVAVARELGAVPA